MAREVKIEFLGDASDLNRATKSANDDLDHFGKRAGTTAGVVGAATSAAISAVASGARALVGFMGDAVKEAEENVRLSKVQAQLLETTGNAANVTAGQLEDYATSLSNKTAIDDEAIMSAQNVLLTFKGVRNETGKGNKVFDRATAAAADLSAVLGTDLQGSTLQLGKALNDPIKGVTALGRAGVQFTKEQKETIKALVESGDLLGAQKIILGEVESQVGGATEANATATQKMTVAWDNFKETIGTAILPAFTWIVDGLIEHVLPALETAASFVSDVATRIADAARAGFEGVPVDAGDGIAGVITKIAEAAGAGFRTALDMLKELGTWAQENRDYIDVAAAALAAFATSLAAIGAAQQAGSAVKSLGTSLAGIAGFLGPWGLLAAAIIAVGVGAYMAYQKFEPFRNVIDSIWQAIQRLWDIVVEFFQQVLPPIIDFVVGLWQQFGDEIIGILTALGEFFAALWARILELWNAFWAIWQPVVSAALAVISALWRQFGDEILAFIGNVWTLIRGVIEGALRIIQGIIQVATGIISGDWSKVWEGIKSIVSGVWSGIKSILEGALNFMRTTWSGITELITAPFNTVKATIDTLLSGAGSAITGIFDKAERAIKSGINAIIDVFNDAINVFNRIPFGPDIPNIPRVRGASASAAPASYGVAAMGRGAVLAPAAYAAPAASTFGSRTIIVNMPVGTSGHDVINAVRKYERRNGTSNAGWRSR